MQDCDIKSGLCDWRSRSQQGATCSWVVSMVNRLVVKTNYCLLLIIARRWRRRRQTPSICRAHLAGVTSRSSLLQLLVIDIIVSDTRCLHDVHVRSRQEYLPFNALIQTLQMFWNIMIQFDIIFSCSVMCIYNTHILPGTVTCHSESQKT